MSGWFVHIIMPKTATAMNKVANIVRQKKLFSQENGLVGRPETKLFGASLQFFLSFFLFLKCDDSSLLTALSSGRSGLQSVSCAGINR